MMQNFKTLMNIIDTETPTGFWVWTFVISLLIGFEYPLVGDIMMLFMTIVLGAKLLIYVYIWIENVVIEYKRQTKGGN